MQSIFASVAVRLTAPLPAVREVSSAILEQAPILCSRARRLSSSAVTHVTPSAVYSSGLPMDRSLIPEPAGLSVKRRSNPRRI